MIINVQPFVRELAPGSTEYALAQQTEQSRRQFLEAIHEAQAIDPTLREDMPGPFTSEQARVRHQAQAITPAGRSLGAWVADFGGYQFQLRGPDGKDYDISIAAWQGRDPATTFLSIGFKYINTNLVGTKLTDRFPTG